MKKSSLLLLFSFLSLVHCGESDSAQAAFPLSQFSVNLKRTEILSGLDRPWDMAFAADGTLFFSERCKGVSVKKPTGPILRLFGTKGSALLAADILCEGQSGVNGIALDPQFAQNRYLYIYTTSKLSAPPTNRVVRLQLTPNLAGVSQRTDIITDIPFKHVGNNWGGAGIHSGGRIRFGSDGFLYITTGDNHNGTYPQDLGKLAGKVLRVDRNGAAAPGNSTPSGGDPRIFTYGHRNVQGLAFHPATKQAVISEHGPNHSDEVTLLHAGGNGGWDPKPGAGVTCADNYCGYTSNTPDGSPTSMTDFKKFPNAMKPILSHPDSEGMGPCLFLNGSQWGDLDKVLLVGIMAGQRLEAIKLSRAFKVESVTPLDVPADRYRSLVQGIDGALYTLTDSGKLWKFMPESKR